MSESPQRLWKNFLFSQKEEAAFAGGSKSLPAKRLRVTHSTEAKGLEKQITDHSPSPGRRLIVIFHIQYLLITRYLQIVVLGVGAERLQNESKSSLP